MKSLDIQIRSETKRYHVSLSRLRNVAKEILKSLGWKEAILSVLLVDDKKIKALNHRYLDHDRPTDVIAFSQLAGPGPQMRRPFLGDIVISLETAQQQAKLYDNSFFYELCFYLCHGILHLMGYRDKSADEAKGMEIKQRRILNQIGLKKKN